MLIYGSDAWIGNRKEVEKSEVPEVRFQRPLQDFIRLVNQRNSDVKEKVKVTNVIEEIKNTNKSKESLKRTEKCRFSQMELHYLSKGQ